MKLPQSELAFHVTLASLIRENLPLVRRRTVRPEPASRRVKDRPDSEEGEEVEAADEAGFERIFATEEGAFWVVHEPALRPHAAAAPCSSVNATVIHSLSTSYIYIEGREEGMRLELLGMAATPASVYQSNVFQHREEIVQSLVALAKLRLARAGGVAGVRRGGLVPVHVAALETVGRCLKEHWTTLIRLAKDRGEEEEEEEEVHH